MLNLRFLIKLVKPLHLFLVALTYALGAGIARYLGCRFQLSVFALGLLSVIAVQTAAYYLVEYFRLPFVPLAQNETPRNRETLRTNIFQSAIALLTVAGAIFLTLFLDRLLFLPAAVLFGLIVLNFMAYAIPPMRLSEKGYGELILAISWGTLIPALAFLLQFGKFHRLLTFATVPITLLALSYFLVSDFPDFASDLKRGRSSLLIRLSWKRAIPIHHLLVLLSFLFFAVTPFLGFPWELAWPVFLVLPFGIFQIVWLQRIAAGGRALWRLLMPLAATVFGLTVYLLALTFWLR
jgi:1,4-dihydroxy-2-naphthoate polyprenyltransferase